MKWINSPDKMVTLTTQSGERQYDFGYVIEGSKWDEENFVNYGIQLVTATEGIRVIQTMGKELGSTRSFIELDMVKGKPSDDFTHQESKSGIRVDVSVDQLKKAAVQGLHPTVASRKGSGETTAEVNDPSYTSRKVHDQALSVYKDTKWFSLTKEVVSTPVKKAGGSNYFAA